MRGNEENLNQLAILKPVDTPKISVEKIKIYSKLYSREAVKNIFKNITGVLAVDIETQGTQAADPETSIVGIGISNGRRNLYFDIRTISTEAYRELLSQLASPSLKLVAHNVFFDAAFLTRDSGTWFNWQWCTYGLYRQLASEGFPEQSWGLKNAQLELLGWQDTNEAELDNWLIENGYWKSPSKHDKPGYTKIMTDNGERWVRPDKSKMAEAPADILGYYCVLDAYSTYMFFTEVLMAAVYNLPTESASNNFLDYHTNFIKQVRLHIQQQLRGINIDTYRLDSHLAYLLAEITQAELDFLNHPEVKDYIDEWNQAQVKEHQLKEPNKYKQKKLGKEPSRLRKDGQVSKNWLKWKEKADQLPEINKNWESWKAKYEQLKTTNHFNLDSSPQRQWLFYEKLKYPVTLRTEKDTPAVNKKALLGFGEPGRLLKRNNDLKKELGYVEGCQKALINGVLHPQFRMPGTLTCRLAGSGGVNIQQLPKSRGYLSCYRPRGGMVFVDCDHTSLEQVVLAELSRDPTLLKLYGPGAKPNDVYLFNGSQLSVIGEQIRAAGYDPDNPTPEGIKSAKKKAKTARSISKVVTLASSYGAGAAKIQETLNLEGIPLTLDEAKVIYNDYWKLYEGVREYERYLLDEYDKRGGWIYNGIGRPVCVAGDYLKDIVNRVVQSTGHDIHIYWANIFYDICLEQELEVHGIVWDFHDQTVIECPTEQADQVMLAFQKAYDRLNNKLEGLIPLSGDPQIVNTLADAKLED